MDPLSIVGGIIAVLQMTDRLLGLVTKLRQHLIDAPSEVSSLSNEIVEFRLLFENFKDVVEDPASADIVSKKSETILANLIQDGQNVCLQLEGILEGQISRNQSQSGSFSRRRRIAWLGKRGQVERLRNRLREARISASSHITSLSLSSQIRVKVAVAQLSLSSVGLREGQARMQVQMQENQDVLQSTMANQFAKQEVLLSQILQSPNLDEKDLKITGQTIELPLTPAIDVACGEKSYPSLVVDASRYREVACQRDCVCSCHQHRYLRPTTFLNQVLGRLFIGYTGVPFADRRCDSSDCRRRSIPAVHVVYYFPQWFLMRAVFLTLSDSIVSSVSLVFPRVVPGGATIFRYIRLGHTEGLKDLLRNRQASAADICGSSGLTVLSYALMSYALYGGCVEVCEILISEGADPFAVSNTALPSSSSDEAWDMLYDYSMDSDIKTQLRRLVPEPNNFASRSFSHLHRSILGISTDPTMALLRSSRPSINDVDSSGRSVLHWSAYKGDADMLNAILRCGADPDLPCISGRTALHYAARVGAKDCVRVLIDSGASLDLRDKQGETPLHLAADRNRVCAAEALLEAGADPNVRNHLGEPPLAYAATENNVDIMHLLLSTARPARAVLDAHDHRGFTPLLDAIWSNAREATSLLLQAGSDPTTCTIDGMSLLHYVAQQGDMAMMLVLLESTIELEDVNASLLNSQGQTALELLMARPDCRPELIEAFGSLVLKCRGDGRRSEVDSQDNLVSGTEEFFDAVEHQLLNEG